MSGPILTDPNLDLTVIQCQTLDYFKHWVNSHESKATYNSFHRLTLNSETRFGGEILSLHMAKKLATEVVESQAIYTNICDRGCAAFVGDRADLQACDCKIPVLGPTGTKIKVTCGTARYTRDSKGDQVAARRLMTLRLEPRLCALFGNEDSA